MFYKSVLSYYQIKGGKLMRKLNEKKYEGFLTKARDIQKIVGIDKDIPYVYMESEYPFDGNHRFNRIGLTKELLDLYETKDEHVLLFILIHELTHLKYKDKRLWLNARSLLLRSNKANALILLQEMRANMEAIMFLNLSDAEIEEGQNFLQSKNNTPMGKEAYTFGYPDRSQIAYFGKKYKGFSEELMEEILEDFCKVRNVWWSKYFTKRIIKKFKRKCYPKVA
jgi:hypothetical protein